MHGVETGVERPMRYYFAPLEGITGAVYRQAHRRFFFGVDRYYAPFLSPTREHRLTPRERRELLPEYNRDVPLVPQLLTRNGADLCWAAGVLADMGYPEVNLNLGCPSGAVVAKKKGAGLLGDLAELERLLDHVFARPPLPVSVKTRLGLAGPEELSPLLALLARYPIAELTIHPRLRTDFYSGPLRLEAFARALEEYPGPICYNGGLTTPADCARLQARFPRVRAVMLGRGLLADPALARRCRGGAGADRAALRAFHDCLYESYCGRFHSVAHVVAHMKEHWRYLSCLFEGGAAFRARLRTVQDGGAYEGLVAELFAASPLRQDAAADWEAPVQLSH